MRIAVALGAFALAAGSGPAFAQAPAPPPSTPQNPVGGAGPLGGYRAPSNDPGAGLAESPGAFAPSAKASSLLKGEYGIDLSRRIADAQRLVDAAGKGRVLTESDSRRIRNLMREDFIAWRKQFDPVRSAYEKQRDRWIVDEKALSPDGWAKQRLDWLEAQRDWIVSNGG
jgi:hypothetical protein